MSKKKNKKTETLYIHMFSKWYHGDMEGIYTIHYPRELTKAEMVQVMKQTAINEYGCTHQDFAEDPNFEPESTYLGDPHRGDYTLGQYQGYTTVEAKKIINY